MRSSSQRSPSWSTTPARGARTVVGGHVLEQPGHFYAPTVLADVPAEAQLLHEEIFGPVAPVLAVDGEDEAVQLANATEYGLVAYLYTRDLARGLRLLGRLETGMVGLNQGLVSNAAAPFGGVKASGIGREGGPEGIEEYLAVQYAALPPLEGERDVDARQQALREVAAGS